MTPIPMVDRSTHHYGILAVNVHGEFGMQILIPAGSELPCREEVTCLTVVDNMVTIRFQVYESIPEKPQWFASRMEAEETLEQMCQLDLELPPNLPKHTPVTMRMELSAAPQPGCGILNVTVLCGNEIQTSILLENRVVCERAR